MRLTRTPVDAAFVLPVAFSLLLVIGAVAAATHGALGFTGVLLLAAIVTFASTSISTPSSVPLVVGVSMLTVMGFGQRPYGQLRSTGPHALIVAATLILAAVTGLAVGMMARAMMLRLILATATAPDEVETVSDDELIGRAPGSDSLNSAALRELAVAIDRRRQLTALLVGAVILPIVSICLAAFRSHLDLDDDLLLFLVVVVGITLLGGFWPAVTTAIAASLLLNWFFTPPLHHWTIDSPQNLFALLLFITVAVSVSSVVHLAARQAAIARRSGAESATLLGLARTVLGGEDTARDVISHLAGRERVIAELQELVSGRWVRVAVSGESAEEELWRIHDIRPDLRVRLAGARQGQINDRTLEGYGAQAAAALDRERLRVQASQAEMLAAGNRMRTALLTAVSHDLRTPLAAVKASVSSLRQTDIVLNEADQAELLATIEENADRLDGLIANLLDMSRLQTGSLQPLLQPISLDEVAPAALRGLDATDVRLDIPDTLPFVAADPGLLERAIANLVANAVRYSPPGEPPLLRARAVNGSVCLDVIDRGPGVPVEMHERIFEPFQQLGDQRNNDGVGLGLAVARGFVEATGGSLTAMKTPGGGLTMHIELQAAASSEAASVVS